MIMRKIVLSGCVGFFGLLNAGCILRADGGAWGCWGCGKVWTEPQTEQVRIETAGLTGLEALTHNGSISLHAGPPGGAEALVTVTKKGGAPTLAGAEEALEAIEVVVQPRGDGTSRIAWKWRGMRHPGWSAAVSFKIEAPGDLRFAAETHNGGIKVEGVTSDVEVVTHNGAIEVNSRGDQLRAETHNGRIVAAFEGDDLYLLTHNGGVTARLHQCDTVGGTIKTHNGAVKLAVGEATGVDLTARTHNGTIHCDVPVTARQVSRATLIGTIGGGGKNLDVTTHNGSIRIERAAG